MQTLRRHSPPRADAVRRSLTAVTAAAALLMAPPLFAYVGPGAGLTMLGALWALLVAVFVAVGFIVVWPLRRMRRKQRQRAAAAHAGNPADDTLADGAPQASPAGAHGRPAEERQ